MNTLQTCSAERLMEVYDADYGAYMNTRTEKTRLALQSIRAEILRRLEPK